MIDIKFWQNIEEIAEIKIGEIDGNILKAMLIYTDSSIINLIRLITLLN